ncbi:MAG: glutamate--tRNA ligase [Thermoproteota archaeon]|nr:MAG: glutamate--tRNA ligase [Candidatus Korarchaeota archaeon]RLG50073.1 MAG: glutamate--tRNA ligase [Candidatus Korarchaeota archaeon]
MEDIIRLIKYHAVKNALKYGKAKVGPVVSKIIAERPELKGQVKQLMEDVKRVVEEVNKLDKGSLEGLAEELRVVLEERREEEERRWPPLPNADAYEVIVTRMAPEPNGYPTLGHVKGLLVPFIYARLYKGKFLLRFEDTNPRVEKLEYYDAIRQELGIILEAAEEELGLSPGKWDKEIIESNDIPRMYEYAKKLIEDGNAYVCTCPVLVVRKNRNLGIECEHRDQPVDKNLELWEMMLDGSFKEGEAHLRLKTDMRHPNRTMRDPGIFRIVEHPHPIHGDRFRVYPNYDFSISVEDALTGVTHAHRSKEFEPHVEVQRTILRMLGLRQYEMIQFGRVTVEGIPLSKRYFRPLIASGILSGWDDPRLPTIRGILRRGISPRALVRFFYDLGPSKADVTISMNAIFAENRRILDPVAPRFMFVPNPIKMVLMDVPDELEADIPVHPSRPEMGERRISLKGKDGKVELYISSQDLQELREGEEVRLWRLANVRIRSILADEVTARYVPSMKTDVRIIHWVPAEKFTPVKLFRPISVYSYEVVGGYGEPNMGKLSVGEIVQLVRYGFARVDSIKKGTVSLIFSHE